MSYLKHDVVNY